MTRATIGLGANEGDRLAALEGALTSLDARTDTSVVAASRVYETAAHVLPGTPPQPDHLNAAIAIKTGLGPRALLRVLHGLERAAGRDHNRPRWAPRPLDLDLLLYGTRVVSVADLHIPHPALADRAFVLRPLADLAPDSVVPGDGRTVAAMLAACTDTARLAVTEHRL